MLTRRVTAAINRYLRTRAGFALVYFVCACMFVEFPGLWIATASAQTAGETPATPVSPQVTLDLKATGDPVGYRFAAQGTKLLVMVDEVFSREITFSESYIAITELSGCLWMDRGFALAIECALKDGKRDYYSLIFYVPDRLVSKDFYRTKVREPQKFLENAADYDLAAIRNSGGDSIYIVLTQHNRHFSNDHSPGTDELSGMVYFHNCPQFGGMPGQIVALRATSGE